MSEWMGRPVPKDKIQRILNAVWWLESYRSLVLGQEESETVDMLHRQVAYRSLKNRVLQQCRFDYTVDLSHGTDRLTPRLYLPRVAYRNGTERTTHQLTSDSKVLCYTYALGDPLPPGEQDPDTLARRLEWLGDAAWFYPGSVTVDSNAGERELEM